MYESQPSPLSLYIESIRKHPVLERDEEMALAAAYRESPNQALEQRLVRANLRFVVKIAGEYRGYGLPLLDLIQEGNVGLLKAVQKFDPEKGNRLISYAVWWIRAYIQSYVMRSWSLVKIGTTQAQRKLFFRIRSEKAGSAEDSSDAQSDAAIAERLSVKPEEVSQMASRMKSRDMSLDVQVHEEGREKWIDQLDDPDCDLHAMVQEREEHRLLHQALNQAMTKLSVREKFIIEQRLMSDEPMTLQQIGSEFGVSRERARQIESVLLTKLRAEFSLTGLQEMRA